MDEAHRQQICDRLLAMKIKIEANAVPNPAYINSKIGLCHAYLEEVEHFIIEISRELATVQQAFNNAQAAYENEKEWLLSHDADILQMSGMSIRDREAKVNSKLKKERDTIKNYQNDLVVLNQVMKAAQLKNKNINTTIKAVNSQLRIMEAQLKLGTPQASDPVVRGLMEEMQKSLIGKDSFEEAVSNISETQVVDPTRPINIEEILQQEEPSANILLTQTDEEENTEFGGLPIEDSSDLIINSGEIEVKTETVVDLDQVIDFQNKGGEKETVPTIKRDEVTSVEAEPKTQKINNRSVGIDLDDLLDSITA